VKLTFGNVEVPQMTIFAIFETLSFDFDDFLPFLRAEICSKTKFRASDATKTDFKQNQNSKKMAKFPHSVKRTVKIWATVPE